jgi:dTDP-4-amino-4,6-dideoxygalactose transaminase
LTEIPFNRPFLTGNEAVHIRAALDCGRLSGDGPFTALCNGWIERETGSARALLTHSCTGALEMAALLADLSPGDEVIMPSFTFVSTANAFVLRGAVPVFVDIRPDTLNIDERLIEDAVTDRTRVIAPVHYAGVACEMDAITEIASRRHLRVIEDAAQGILSTYKGRALGAIGDLGALSFHETKNVISGEGGALLVNDVALSERAEVLREKGTNRSKFLKGQVDKYTWVDIGSSYLPSEVIAAFLWAQLEQARSICERRLSVWSDYHGALADAEASELLRRPTVPADCGHNAHIYYVLAPSAAIRDRTLEVMRHDGVQVTFHYVPLHSSPAGRRFGRTSGRLALTDDLSARLIRLPLWIGVEVDRVVDGLCRALRSARDKGSRP